MPNFIGVKCPVCSKPFKEDDDIVVCPTCGAPYHRSCYEEHGDCIFEELHQEGKSWEAPEAELPKTASPYEVKDQDCPRCGVLNAHSSLFCSSCGSPLKIEPGTHNNSQHVQSNPFPPIYNMGGIPIQFDPMGGVRPTDMLDENISFGEISKIVQQNTQYYMPVFNRINREKKSKFNFCAFLFSGGWLLYRKQYKTGIIYTVFMFALYLGQIFTANYISVPKLVALLDQAGETISEQGITAAQIYAISGNMSPSDLLIIAIPSLLMLAMFVVMLILGFRGNRMYMKHCIRTINETRNTTVNVEDFNTRIVERGGINTTASLCVLICYFLCTYLPLFFY